MGRLIRTAQWRNAQDDTTNARTGPEAPRTPESSGLTVDMISSLSKATTAPVGNNNAAFLSKFLK